MRRAIRSRRGFTLIEMMISLLISTLLVIMILSIFARMSFSYREQQQIVALQQSLAAARQAFEQDAKQAGLMMSQGFNVANPLTVGNNRVSPIEITNSATGPDQVAFYYADTSKQALVTAGTLKTAPLVIDSKDAFTVGEVVVLSLADTSSFANPLSIDDAKIAKFAACVVQIASISGTAPATITFSTAAPWGQVGNGHCPNAVPYGTMMYKFVAHAWRIDTSRPDLAPLQMSTTGNLVSPNVSFTDQAYGFTDIQTSTYFYDGNGLDTADPDTDGDRDWYSSTDQFNFTKPIPVASTFLPPLMMTISLVNRTAGGIEGITTSATPLLSEVGNTTNNPTGDHASVTLPSATDPLLMGNRIYRYITFQVDLRNMGVGR